MDTFETDGCDTLDDAARGDFPSQFVTLLGRVLSGDTATVWFLTNNQPPFEP
jgi:hypothetical protein